MSSDHSELPQPGCNPHRYVKRWTDAGRPTSRKKLRLPFPLMVLVYCGEEDLGEGSLWFQNIFGEEMPNMKPFTGFATTIKSPRKKTFGLIVTILWYQQQKVVLCA